MNTPIARYDMSMYTDYQNCSFNPGFQCVVWYRLSTPSHMVVEISLITSTPCNLMSRRQADNEVNIKRT